MQIPPVPAGGIVCTMMAAAAVALSVPHTSALLVRHFALGALLSTMPQLRGAAGSAPEGFAGAHSRAP